MNELKVFDYAGKGVRTVEVENSTWWVLKDVCDVLGIQQAVRTAERLDDDEVSLTHLIDSLGRQQEKYTNIKGVNEFLTPSAGGEDEMR